MQDCFQQAVELSGEIDIIKVVNYNLSGQEPKKELTLMPEPPNLTSRQVYKSRIQKVMGYLDENLNKELDLDHLAEISRFPKRYLPRIFRALTGSTLEDYLLVQRLEKAAGALTQNPNVKIQEIAEGLGMDVNDFTLVFMDTYGMTPTEFRRGGFELPPLEATGGEFPPVVQPIRQPNVVHLENTHVVYLPTVRGQGRENMRLARLAINQWAMDHKMMNDHNQIIGISVDDPFTKDLDECRYFAAVSIPLGRQDEIIAEEPIGKSLIHGGPYLKARFSCSRNQVAHAYETLFRDYLPDCGYDIADLPYLDMYLTLQGNESENPIFTFDIFLPLAELVY